jgi:hypothetical protein
MVTMVNYVWRVNTVHSGWPHVLIRFYIDMRVVALDGVVGTMSYIIERASRSINFYRLTNYTTLWYVYHVTIHIGNNLTSMYTGLLRPWYWTRSFFALTSLFVLLVCSLDFVGDDTFVQLVPVGLSMPGRTPVYLLP